MSRIVCLLTCGDLSLSENSRSTSVALLTDFAPCARSLLLPLGVYRQRRGAWLLVSSPRWRKSQDERSRRLPWRRCP
eukprot:4710286-Prymnesium_polylepis.1